MKKQSRVFIVQEPMKRDQESGAMVSAFNFNRASEYGELIVLLPGGNVALSTAPTLFRLKEQLHDFNDDDFLIAAGDPSAIAMAVAVASAKNNGRFQLLKYDRDARAYIKVAIDINQRMGSQQLSTGFEAAPAA
jgi:hypothetical protein